MSELTQPIRALFLGNSQMFYFDVPRMIEVMAASAPHGRRRVAPGKSLIGGASLETHWDKSRGLIEQGGWDVVVIQEIYSRGQAVFTDFADRFAELIRGHGGAMLIFATANVTRHYGDGRFTFPDSTRSFNDFQVAYAKRKRLPVAAAGHAWLRFLGPGATEDWALDLYAPDKGHPGAKGSYLYACLLYACLTGHSPVGLAHVFHDIRGGVSFDAHEADRMQRAALEQFVADHLM